VLFTLHVKMVGHVPGIPGTEGHILASVSMDFPIATALRGILVTSLLLANANMEDPVHESTT